MKASNDCRVILITGGSSGLGAVCVNYLASRGHRVYGTSRRAEFPSNEGSLRVPLIIPMDVCEAASIEAAVRQDAAVGAMERDEQSGADPKCLAVLLEKIMEKKRVRPRYLVGMFFQKLAVRLKCILPASVFEKLIMSYYRS